MISVEFFYGVNQDLAPWTGMAVELRDPVRQPFLAVFTLEKLLRLDLNNCFFQNFRTKAFWPQNFSCYRQSDTLDTCFMYCCLV